jgi:hypothetical protein
VKKRFIIGLVAIFTVVLVGGGLVSNIMSQLYTVNTARFLMDRVTTIITSLDIKVLQTIKGIETVQYTEEDIRMLLDRVEDIRPG